ncbi:chromosome partitioning protein, ParB family [Verrucomicrobium sp. GAS474]|uniref:ParB/RepB/Spo0J family partition protein n=1 Tax=Verrucomicrobium sp. GAS474 TaxID=1882831 RepID=UPI00087D6DCA|nr:ParB/RepB/Spo0J family partition protein [Verrucomicrobium sp. GAS474]SDT97779.1 chromosome partitioning protein, ParB family [Verrucomicrobium sp. GAS474]
MAGKGLGRGLSALIGAGAQGLASPQPQFEKGETVRRIPLEQIVPSPFQPRKNFAPEQLAELVESVREKGIIQPLVVRLVGGKYELIAGERRWRASQAAGLKEAPVIVRAASDREVLELALIENLQRADLDPVEEAEAYALLINQFRLTQEQVAQRVGKSRANVANALRLLTLSEDLRSWVSGGRLSVGHAKVILGLPDKETQAKVADRVLKDNLTVRATEKLVESLRPRSGSGSAAKGSGAKAKAPAPVTEAAWADLEKRLQRALGTRVRLAGTNQAGKVVIEYFSADELDRLLKALGVTEL